MSAVLSANGAAPYQPGATPQESNRPLKQRAEGPSHCLDIPPATTLIGRAFSPHGIITGLNLGRWPRLVWARAFGPETPRAFAFCRTSRYDTEPHFRGVTKMVPHEITQRKTAAGRYQRTSSQGILDYSNRRRVTEDSSATARSVAKATIKESLTVQTELRRVRTTEDSSVVRTPGRNELLGLSGFGIGRAFSPQSMRVPHSWGDAPGWYGSGPLALRTKGAQPIFRRVPFYRAKGASPYQPRPTAWDRHPQTG